MVPRGGTLLNTDWGSDDKTICQFWVTANKKLIAWENTRLHGRTQQHMPLVLVPASRWYSLVHADVSAPITDASNANGKAA